MDRLRRTPLSVGFIVVVVFLVGGLAGCRSLLGRNTGPIDAFAFLPEQNAGLTEPVQGAINNRPDPKEISVVVPPGTDMSRLVATITLNTEATITVISTGSRVPQTGLTPNNYNVPVTYAIELPGEDEPVLYTVRVREASTNARLIELAVSDSTYQRPTFGPTVTAYEAEVPFATTSVQVSARAEDPRAFAISVNGVRAGSGQASGPVDFAAGDAIEIVVEVVAEDRNTRQEYRITVYRGEPDRNSNLTALTVEGADLSQVFRTDRITYTAEIPYGAAELRVVAQPESPFATVDVNGFPIGPDAAAVVPLDDVQKQPIEAIVTAQDGSTTAYVITVTRAAPDGTVRLQSIAATGATLSPAFRPDQEAYLVVLAQDEKSVVLDADTASALSSVAASSDSPGVQVTGQGTTARATVNPGEGESAVVVFTITAESGDTGQYRVVVRRELGLASLVLSELVAEGVSLAPQFDPETTEYSATVAPEIDVMRLVATWRDPSIEVSVGDEAYASRPALIDVLLYDGVRSSTSIRLAAPNGLERVYTVEVERPTLPSRIGRRILGISTDELALSRQVAANLNSSRADLDPEARIRVRYHREPDVIYEDFTPVTTERARQNILVSMNYRSQFIDVDLGRYLEIEVSIPVAGARYLTYHTVVFADGDLDLRPEFMVLADAAEMVWPEPGVLRPVAGRVMYQVSPDALARIEAIGDAFELNDEGEFETTLRVVDPETGAVFGTEILPTKPRSIHGRGLPSIEGIEFPEGSKLGYVLTARTRDGRLLRAHGSVEVRTTETFDDGVWEFAPVFIEAALDLVDTGE